MATNGNPELTWQRLLGAAHFVPLHALSYTVTTRLGLYLDQEVEDTNPNGVIGDFGGLADLIGFDSLEIQGFERVEKKGKQVLEEWKRRPEMDPTVANLVKHLLTMGREDILNDMQENIRKDVSDFLSKSERFRQGAPIQDQTVSPGPGFADLPEHITLGDVMERKKTMYHAFVCYNPYGNSERDLDFVRELISRLESPPHNLKLFVPHRDDLPGLNENEITAKIISERCRHMIVVLSQNFLKSEALEFQAAFAFSLSPAARKRRMVPVRLDNCPTPNIMCTMAMCDFTKRELWDWSWNRLAFSVNIPLTDEDFQFQARRSLEGEAMSERDVPSFTDSAIGSMSSGSSIGACSNQSSAQQTYSAPVARSIKEMDTSTSMASSTQRPFTENFTRYPGTDKTTSPPSMKPYCTASQSPSRTRSPQAVTGKTSHKKGILPEIFSKSKRKNASPN